MFYDIISRIFGYQHFYQFFYKGGYVRVYDVKFALDYDPHSEKKTITSSWRKAKRWVENDRFVTPLFYEHGELRSWAEEVDDFDIYNRQIVFGDGVLTYIGRCRKSRRWL